MGKKKRKQGKAGKKRANDSQNAGADLDSLCEQATVCLERFQYDEAITLLQRALEVNGSHTEAMDLLAQCLMELGRPDQAEEWLVKSTNMAPTTNPTKWLSLGQLYQGSEALACFQKGIEVMKASHNSMQDNDEEGGETDEERNREISSALCSIAELYTTDLCDMPEAESGCENALEEALAMCESNPEVHYGLGNLRLIQGRVDEAMESGTTCLQLLNQHAEEEEDVRDVLSYEFRTTAGKLALELQLYEGAVTVFENLLREDDRFVEVWHLCGVCYKALDDVLSAHHYFNRALSMANKALGQDVNDPSLIVESDGVEEMTRLRDMIGAELAQISPADLQRAQQEAEVAGAPA